MRPTDLTEPSARAVLAGVRRDGDTAEGVVDALARAVWSAVAEPGDGAAGALVRAVGAADALRLIHTDDAPPAAAGIEAGTFAAAKARWRPRIPTALSHTGLPAARTSGAALLTPADASWPRRVDDLGLHAPLCLWVRGDIGPVADGRPTVAIVGARAATSYGDHVAGELAAEVAAAGAVVVSGAAYGVDGAAHRAALRSGGATVALSAGGVERAYPSGHAQLVHDVVGSGALVSEVPCGTAPTKWRFLQRNRLIAALGDVTVVVEAGWRSGSLNTAGHAASMGRPLGAVPGPITSAASVGCHRMLREFGAACITSGADVLELLGLASPALFPAPEGRTDEVTRVRDAMSARAWRGPDEIALRCGMPTADVEAILGLLQLEGTAQRDGGAWRRAPRSG
ncbi:DNA-processing protein DprA [Microbacterium aureliae]